jgi:hypothetical protein
MEGERESFSNRAAIRKILPENNVLAGQSICAFFRGRRKAWLVPMEAKPGGSLRLSGKWTPITCLLAP